MNSVKKKARTSAMDVDTETKAVCENDPAAGLFDSLLLALTAVQIPEIPERFREDPRFLDLWDYIAMVRKVLARLSSGNMRSRVTHKGFIAAALKDLQSQLRLLTWHADRVASGDFCQHIDFMGNYAEPFNRMSRQFYDTLSALKESEANLLKTTADLHMNEERWKLAIACTQDGIWDIDLKACTAFFSKRLWEILRYPPRGDDIDFQPRRWIRYVHLDDRAIWACLADAMQQEALPDVKEMDGRQYAELRIRGGDRRYRWIGINYMLLRDESGAPYRFIGACEDIQERREREEAIRLQATHDQLTGLPNRYLYNDRLRYQVLVARRTRTAIILIVWDLDGFKYINDTHGHLAGDRVLVTVAELMKNCLRESDTLARFGGDEFVMILTSSVGHEADVALATTKRIFEVLKEPIDIGGGTKVSVGASCGISFYPKHTSQSEFLFDLADKALYYAKRNGKNRAEIWCQGIGSD